MCVSLCYDASLSQARFLFCNLKVCRFEKMKMEGCPSCSVGGASAPCKEAVSSLLWPKVQNQPAAYHPPSTVLSNKAMKCQNKATKENEG